MFPDSKMTNNGFSKEKGLHEENADNKLKSSSDSGLKKYKTLRKPMNIPDCLSEISSNKKHINSQVTKNNLNSEEPTDNIHYYTGSDNFNSISDHLSSDKAFEADIEHLLQSDGPFDENSNLYSNNKNFLGKQIDNEPPENMEKNKIPDLNISESMHQDKNTERNLDKSAFDSEKVNIKQEDEESNAIGEYHEAKAIEMDHPCDSIVNNTTKIDNSTVKNQNATENMISKSNDHEKSIINNEMENTIDQDGIPVAYNLYVNKPSDISIETDDDGCVEIQIRDYLENIINPKTTYTLEVYEYVYSQICYSQFQGIGYWIEKKNFYLVPPHDVFFNGNIRVLFIAEGTIDIEKHTGDANASNQSCASKLKKFCCM